MDPRLREVLKNMVLNVNFLCDELTRLVRSEQLQHTPETQQLVELAHDAMVRGLETVRETGRRIRP